jgi:hypothetical protein
MRAKSGEAWEEWFRGHPLGKAWIEYRSKNPMCSLNLSDIPDQEDVVANTYAQALSNFLFSEMCRELTRKETE